MKNLPSVLAGISALVLFTAVARAQDDSAATGAPPPPPLAQAGTGGDQGGPVQAPPPPDQGAPMQQVPPSDQGQQYQSVSQDPGAPQGQDDQGASFQDFYDQLGDQGTWVQTSDYGYVFQPTVSDPNWAPYTDGRWVYTDDGWTWVSDEPWGWATYHYGRWANIDNCGWVWVPGHRWAPAWVSWRYGGGYCGWAPLPPETFVGVDYGRPGVAIGAGFHFGGDVDVSFNIGPGCYNFVPVGYMGARNYRGHYLDRGRNYVVINNTTNITNINVGGAGRERNFRGVNAGGPPLAQINAHSQERIQNVRLTQAGRPGRNNLQGNSLAVYAPQVNAGSRNNARPGRVGQTIDHPRFNRGDSISKPMQISSNVRPHAPSGEEVQAAEAARHHAPAGAKIANENTQVRTPLNQPLTSLQPVGEERGSHSAPAAGFNNGINQSTVGTPGATAPATGTTHVGSPNHEQRQAGSPTFTGEPTQRTTTPHTQTEVAPAGTYHPPTQSYHPQSGGNLHPFESPAPTYHPQTQVAPTQTYHPPTQTQTYHPQSSGGDHPSESRAPTYYPQTQVAPTQTYHPPAPTYHPQPSGGFHPSEAPAQTYHPQSQAAPTYRQTPAPAQSHQSAPAAAPQVHQSAPAPQASHPAPAAAPQSHIAQPAPAGGNGQNQNNGQKSH